MKHFTRSRDQAFFIQAACDLRARGALIACIYVGSDVPAFCEPMPRDPLPELGMVVDSTLSASLREALQINNAVHDGAMMIRANDTGPFELTGWSYRLYPPPVANVPLSSNRGSAFNSCLAMSVVDRVQWLYLLSQGTVTVFENGGHCLLA
jgi:hypothetical protein